MVSEAVGGSLLDFARPRLFDPLGIDSGEAYTGTLGSSSDSTAYGEQKIQVVPAADLVVAVSTRTDDGSLVDGPSLVPMLDELVFSKVL